MFTISKGEELDEKLIYKMLNRFSVDILPRLNSYKNYYNGVQAILNKSYSDESKPCSKTVINYCKNIADSYTGYIASPGYISYNSENDIEDIMQILRYNDYQAEDSEFLLNALIYGTAAELMFTDEEGQVRFRLIDPASCFGVFDDTLTGDLLYFIRFYKASEWTESNEYHIDVYTESEIKHYKAYSANGMPELTGVEYHYFSQCPANIFYMPEEASIFDCIISLQDAVNELISDEIDDYSAFCDAYLSLAGVDAEEDDIRKMKENRVLILPPDASASWLTKSANDAQVENILKRLHDSIYRIAQCPDFSSETFVGGVSSGIAIRYRLTGMENKAAQLESLMKKALQRRVEIISGIASLKLGETVFRDINISFKRNIPEDLTATINLINTLKGTVSDATLLSQLSFIPDVNAEIEAVEEQKKRNMETFGLPLHEEKDDETEEEKAGDQ